MKTLFLHAKSNVDIKPVLRKLNFKGKLGIITSIQFLGQLEEFFEKNMDEKNKEGKFVFGGQILGCNVNNALKIKDKVDGFLFIGSGDFHPLQAVYKMGKLVYVANPYTNNIKLLDRKEFDNYEKRKKSILSRFLMAKKIGILVSVKPGQFHPKEYLGLREKIELAEKIRKKIKDKESYIFIGDNFNLDELENFKDIEMWVNTACPRIEGKNLINMEEVFRLYEK